MKILGLKAYRAILLIVIIVTLLIALVYHTSGRLLDRIDKEMPEFGLFTADSCTAANSNSKTRTWSHLN